ncbi:hypothetical protein [Nocardia sp. 348MFTsu5.1]|uniref:hypothetical protein n=1 Tax=Nocardia sp. 348MFTsu5.1 TaxID=1172185 RepID=UPI0012DC586B|nr:hypothetical protein [Nocardia sp. 348MFTsu5.1]
MPLSSADQELVATMKQREFHLKRRQRAADTIHYELRRHRVLMVGTVAVLVAGALLCMLAAMRNTLPDTWGWWRPALVTATLGAVLGSYIGQSLLHTAYGRKLLVGKENRVREKYSADLHAGRRWLQYYYEGENISGYVPQILYSIEGERRFDSVAAALAWAKASRRVQTEVADRAMDRFTGVTAQINLAVIASTDQFGRPSSRLMRFVISGRPGVWYVTTAPESPKVQEFDHGRIALLTLPTESGETIGSNRVQIRCLGTSFSTIAELYRTQVPGYLDGLTEEEQQRELVYELTLESATADNWSEHDVVEFRDRELPEPDL